MRRSAWITIAVIVIAAVLVSIYLFNTFPASRITGPSSPAATTQPQASPPAASATTPAVPPLGCTILFDNPSLKLAEKTTMRWAITGAATKLTINDEPVTLSGSRQVEASALGTTNYLGVVTDAKGVANNCSATLTVAAANETRVTTGPSGIDISALDPATLRLILIVLLVVAVVLALSNWWSGRVLWTVLSVVLFVLLAYNLLPQLFNLNGVIVTPLTLGSIVLTPVLSWILAALLIAAVAAIFVARGTAFGIFIGVLVFALFFSADFRAELSRLAGLSFTAIEGEPRAVEVVSPSPRALVPAPTLCDGTRRLVVYGGAFLPATPNCHANWNIAAESPGNCVIAIGVNGPLTPVVCKYNQDIITVTSPISGWRTTGSEVWLDVTYTPKASTRTAVLIDP